MILGRHRLFMLVLTWLFAAAAWALHSDEAGIVDWHHSLIGTPIRGATFLHENVAGLSFALTDKNVLAALNMRDGAVGKLLSPSYAHSVWRQLLDDPKKATPLDGGSGLSGRD